MAVRSPRPTGGGPGSVAVDGALHSQEAQGRQQQLTHERDRCVLSMTNSVPANLEARTLRAVSATLRRVMHCDAVGVQVLEEAPPVASRPRLPQQPASCRRILGRS